MKAQLIAELENESTVTSVLLEAVPASQFLWKPHAKSMSAGALAKHIAIIPAEMTGIFEKETVDLSDMNPQFDTCETTEELMSLFQTKLYEGISNIRSWDEETLMKEWKLTKGSETVFTIPRGAGIRSFLLNHLYHHRGQLSVYLRLLDIPVPSTYGPTADVNPFA